MPIQPNPTTNPSKTNSTKQFHSIWMALFCLSHPAAHPLGKTHDRVMCLWDDQIAHKMMLLLELLGRFHDRLWTKNGSNLIYDEFENERKCNFYLPIWIPFAIKFNGAEKLELLCCVCNANHRARMNFGLKVNMYNSLGKKAIENCVKNFSEKSCARWKSYRNSNTAVRW